MKSYKVWFSKHSYTLLTASSKKEARERAWSFELEGNFKYGWKKEDFIKNATVEEIE